MPSIPSSLPLARYDELPFVTSARRSATPDWTLPPVGGYHAGHDAGAAMAMAFLKHLRTLPPDAAYTFQLTRVVESFLRRFEAEGGASELDMPPRQRASRMGSLCGQWAGFFNVLSTWLTDAARRRAPELDAITLAALQARLPAAPADDVDEDGGEPVRAWLGELDMAGPFCGLARLQEILMAAPEAARRAPVGPREIARQMFWFAFGLYRGRAAHEPPVDEPEPIRRFHAMLA